MDTKELMFDEYDDTDYYIKDDDADAVSLADSEDSEICPDEACNICTEPQSDIEPVRQQSTRLGQKDQLHYIYKKKFIDSVNEDLHQKEVIANKTRDEMFKCQDRITELERERDSLFLYIAEADTLDDVPNGDRLRAQHERALMELDMERGIEESIKKRLDDAEYKLAQAELEKGKYMLAEEELHRQKSAIQQQKLDDYIVRKTKEDKYVQGTYNRQKQLIDETERAAREFERREKQAISESLKAQEKTSKYLQQTMKKVRDETRSENERHSAETNRRINAVLSLKRNITTNKDNINALRARNKDIEEEAKTLDKAYMDQITAQGGDAQTALLVKKRVEEMERAKVEHELKQREQEVNIAAKLINEEEQFKRRQQMYPHLWQEKTWEQSLRVKPHKKKKLKTLQADLTSSNDYENYISQLANLPKMEQPEARELYKSRPSLFRQDSSDDESDNKTAANIVQQLSSQPNKQGDATTLAKPEFEGMWNKFEKYVVPKDSVQDVIKGSKVSKMEQSIMREKLQKQRENIVQTQVAAGRVFEGKSSFNSKPTVVHFKDFDVGKSYKKKVTLTNVSYSINFCKLVGLSDHLKDFIDINFEPPGQLSAGMTCEILITFKPMINEDLEGVINFLSQTGPFELPVICSTKKCDLSIDVTEVQFGTSVIGETLRRHVILTNNGALGTKLMFGKYTGKDHHIVTAKSPEFSQRGGTPASEMDAPATPVVTKEDDGEEGGLSKPKSPTGSAVLPPGGDELPRDENAVDSRAGGNESAMESSVGADLSDTHDLDLDGMMVSENNAMYIKPFSQEKLEVVWKPTVPGKCDAQFILSFEDEASADITLTSSGTAIDVPVYVTRQNIDLKICMQDRLYQDSITVKNRATSALKLMFEVPKSLRKHMELLPKTGFVQAQSSFSAQLKFLPRSSLAEDAPEFFDPSTGVLEVPLIINVADQTRPVPFVVHAIVTNSDLEFNVTDIDFGHCTIYESVTASVKLTNKSILPQEFGFLGIPNYVDIQPNDGFGIILPEETIELEVIFSPPKAENYSFDLSCKSLINREFKIKCKGVGVHPPLELSKQILHFKATSLNDYSVDNLYVINNHLSSNEYTHPVPRIGKGTIAPVGPTSFEFKVPKGAPLIIYPSVGTVKPGEKTRVQIRFAPVLHSEAIKQEAVRIVTRKAEEKAKKEYDERIRKQKEEAEAQAGKKKGAQPSKPSGKASPKGKGGNRPQTGVEMDISGPESVVPPNVESIKMESDDYASAHSSLLRQYGGDFQTYVIPCYVASGACTKPGQTKYSIHNTLYLEIHCPSMKPQVVVISDNGRTTIDYGDVSIGQQMNKTVTIQNISDKEIPLTGSLLDTTGPFEMRNPLRELPPEASHSLIIQFAPSKPDVFQETLHIYGPESTLHVNLLGRGVNPTIQLNLEDRIFDMGAVLVNEYVERTFKIKNTSSLSVDYMIKFDSLSQLRYKMMQELPDFVSKDEKKSHVIGVQNHNGKCVFDCVPYAGAIPGGGSKEITLTFAPDHASDHFSDGVHVELFSMEEAYSFQVIGQAKEHIMYVTGGQEMKPNVESLVPMINLEPDEDAKPIAGNILLMFYSVAKDGVFSSATAELIIGCVRTMAVSQKKVQNVGGTKNTKQNGGGAKKAKKNGEYLFENMNLINAKGFTISEPKAYLEAGTKKNLTITWTPPETHNPDTPLEASIIVTTKCEITENYQILLRGIIVSQPPNSVLEAKIEDMEYQQQASEVQSVNETLKSKT